MEQAPDTTIIYKRNSVWWIATCYLLGSLLLLIFAVLYLVGMFASLGVDGISALQESHESQQIEKTIAASIHDKVTIESFKIDSAAGRAELAIGIRNGSSLPIEYIAVEIAYLDEQGAPVSSQTERLRDMAPLFPGDTGYTRISYAIDSTKASYKPRLRVAGFKIVGDDPLESLCTQKATSQ